MACGGSSIRRLEEMLIDQDVLPRVQERGVGVFGLGFDGFALEFDGDCRWKQGGIEICGSGGSEEGRV